VISGTARDLKPKENPRKALIYCRMGHFTFFAKFNHIFTPQPCRKNHCLPVFQQLANNLMDLK
jgi:hypothetical protein